MGEILHFLSLPLLLGGLFFFATGSVGIIRFPDCFSRLHAVTKADTAGLGLVAAGLALRADYWQTAALLFLIWLVVMASGAINCQLLASYAMEEETAGTEREKESWAEPPAGRKGAEGVSTHQTNGRGNPKEGADT